MLGHWPMTTVPPRREVRLSWPPRDGHLYHLSPNHSVAMPRNEKNPTTSVTVVTNTPDEIAGSAWKRWSTSGTRMPPSAPAQEIADHGEADHQAEIGHLEPRCRCNAGDDREGQTVDQPHKHLAQDEARGVGARQFVHRERA